MSHQIIAIISILLLLLPGCTSVRNFEEPKFKKLKGGEVATIYQTDGRVQVLEIIEITPEVIRGRVDGSQAITSVAVHDIESVEVERTDYVLSGAAFAGGVVVMAAASILGMVMLLGAGA